MEYSKKSNSNTQLLSSNILNELKEIFLTITDQYINNEAELISFINPLILRTQILLHQSSILSSMSKAELSYNEGLSEPIVEVGLQVYTYMCSMMDSIAEIILKLYLEHINGHDSCVELNCVISKLYTNSLIFAQITLAHQTEICNCLKKFPVSNNKITNIDTTNIKFLFSQFDNGILDPKPKMSDPFACHEITKHKILVPHYEMIPIRKSRRLYCSGKSIDSSLTSLNLRKPNDSPMMIVNMNSSEALTEQSIRSMKSHKINFLEKVNKGNIGKNGNRKIANKIQKLAKELGEWHLLNNAIGLLRLKRELSSEFIQNNDENKKKYETMININFKRTNAIKVILKFISESISKENLEVIKDTLYSYLSSNEHYQDYKRSYYKVIYIIHFRSLETNINLNYRMTIIQLICL